MRTEEATYYGIERDRVPHAVVGVLNESGHSILDLRHALEPFERLRVVAIDPDLERITGSWLAVVKDDKIVDSRAFLKSLEIVR